MCEQLVARSGEPFRLDALWPLVERLERFGIAGFGWGATWLTAGGSLRTHRDVRACFRLVTIGFASTGLSSVDRSLFRHAATGATHRAVVRLQTSIALDKRGWPAPD